MLINSIPVISVEVIMIAEKKGEINKRIRWEISYFKEIYDPCPIQ
jgi:hypothetical protein